MTWWGFVYWLTIRPRLKRLRYLLPEAKVFPTGSRYICNPPVMNTDVDFLIYSENFIKTKLILIQSGYLESNLKDYISCEKWEFFTMRRGIINVIISNSKEFVNRHIVATDICMRQNMEFKDDRVITHSIVRDGEENIPSYYSFKPLVKGFLGPYSLSVVNTYISKYDLESIK